LNGSTIPIQLFGSTVSSSLISKAVTFLKSIDGGRVNVPSSTSYEAFNIVVRKNKTGNFITKFECGSHKYPTGSTARPVTGDAWEIGDIIYNSDYENSSDKCIGWICTKGGIPGTWSTYGSSEEQEIEKIVNRINRTLVIELKASKWSSSAPYTQSYLDSDISPDDYPIISYYVEEGDSIERIQNIKEAFSCIDDGTTYDGYITFTCGTEKPTVDFSVILRGV
jgi:hypothetical protein